MATNPPPGKGRVGFIKKRDQVFSSQNTRWTKRNMNSGQFMDQKFNKAPFKGVRKKGKKRR